MATPWWRQRWFVDKQGHLRGHWLDCHNIHLLFFLCSATQFIHFGYDSRKPLI